MPSILDHCTRIGSERLRPGAVLLAEGQKSDRIYVLIEGEIDVSRGDIRITLIKEPGSVSAVHVHVFEDARRFFRSEPEAAFLLARLLAHRLNAATGYLVDLKRQFAAQGNHLALVEEVLQSLICQQYEEFSPGSDRDPGA
jgi:CRP/FNR family cyclic AMP-dependent transcriptional regulator